MSTKLILVEGLPGSGKTTLAKEINQHLLKAGVPSTVHLEGELSHPVDYDGVAYFTLGRFKELMSNHLNNQAVLEKITIPLKDAYMIPYKKILHEGIIHFPEELLPDVVKNDVYELPLGRHMDLIQKKWEEFVKIQQNKDCVVILECVFIQNPVTVTLVRDNAPHSLTKSYVQQLAEIIRPLEPLLIYLQAPDLKASFERIVQERPKNWYEGFEDYYTNRGFGLYKGLRGIDGVLEVLNERQKLELEIVDSLEMEKHLIENSYDDKKIMSAITPLLVNLLPPPTETR